MTNREWLNNLSDEELADKFGGIDCSTCMVFCDYPQNIGDCHKGFVLWLKEEHFDEED